MVTPQEKNLRNVAISFYFTELFAMKFYSTKPLRCLSTLAPVKYDYCHILRPYCTTKSSISPVSLASEKSSPTRATNILAAAEKIRNGLKAVPQVTEAGSTNSQAVFPDILSKLTPQQFSKVERETLQRTEREERILNQDNLFQMDISTKDSTQSGGVAAKIFWKSVSVVPITHKNTSQEELGNHSSSFHGVQVDGRFVKAFETTPKVNLLLPTKDYAFAVAREWATQQDVLDKTLMPLTDIASAAMYHVGPGGIAPRVDYIAGFLRSDNTFFRCSPLEEEQDRCFAPIHDWFERTFEVATLPRVEKLRYPNISPGTMSKVQGVLRELDLNSFQAVSLCILVQYTASLILPLAVLFTNGSLLSTNEMLRLSHLEENFNTKQQGSVKGFHDIRESDVRVKVAAAVCAWKLTEGLSTSACLPPPPRVENGPA